MEILAARAGRLEVEHRLHGERALTHQLGQDAFDPAVEHVAHRQRSDGEVGVLMRVNHARIERERVGPVVLAIAAVVARELHFAQAGHRAVLVLLHESVANDGGLFAREQAAGNDEPIAVERVLLRGGQERFSFLQHRRSPI